MFSKSILFRFSNGTDFQIWMVPNTVALKSKPLEVKRAVRLYGADNPALLILGANDALYTSSQNRVGPVITPHSPLFIDFLRALFRLGLIDSETLETETALHESLLEVVAQRACVRRLEEDAQHLGIFLDPKSHQAVCAKLWPEHAINRSPSGGGSD